MASRRVTKSGKDSDGDITKLCNPSELWSPRSKSDAIQDINNNIHTYYVQSTNGGISNILVVDGPTGKYLRTSPNGTSTDNLDNLPDC